MAFHTIDEWRIISFRNSVTHLLQEMGGRLRSTVGVEGGLRGKAVQIANYIGPIDTYPLDQRFQDVKPAEADHTRRWFRPKGYGAAILEDDRDKLLTNMEPGGAYEKIVRNAFAVTEDQVIVQAMFDTASLGEQGADTETWSDTGKLVDVAVGGPNSGLNHEKLLAINEVFSRFEVNLEAESKFMLISEKDVTSLFGTTLTVSRDYVDGRPIETYKLPPLYGFNFIQVSSTTLKKWGLFDGSNTYTLPVWLKSGMTFGLWEDLSVQVDRLPTKHGPTYQIAGQQTMAAVRGEPGRVLKAKVYYA